MTYLTTLCSPQNPLSSSLACTDIMYMSCKPSIAIGLRIKRSKYSATAGRRKGCDSYHTRDDSIGYVDSYLPTNEVMCGSCAAVVMLCITTSGSSRNSSEYSLAYIEVHLYCTSSQKLWIAVGRSFSVARDLFLYIFPCRLESGILIRWYPRDPYAI